MSRKIEYIVCHCTATEQSATPTAIQRYWREKLGWKNPGYHYLISADGTVHTLAGHEVVCNGVAGFNSKSIHLSYIGGKSKDDRTEAQKKAIDELLRKLRVQYPTAVIQGHKDFPNVKKSCPRYNAKIEHAAI
jgi:N-acetylmuramoyl-L-alanine amidase